MCVQDIDIDPEASLCQPIKEGKWSVIQIVGHLYYWDKFNLEQMIPYMDEGVDLPEFPDQDQHNQKLSLKDFSVTA
ncbi:DinB family protein [Amphibacillus sediminis]|uniref:DinB family protein n=1 Tax=Amphibacillus sediminis TaxID=360185 RepID=UPI003570BC4D